MVKGILFEQHYFAIFKAAQTNSDSRSSNGSTSADLLRVMQVIISSWKPFPRNTDSSMPLVGGLNTSPCTSFHPNSSCASS